MLSGVLGVIESISSYIMSIWYHHSPAHILKSEQEAQN